MTTEQVLFDDPESNITVTDQRYIVGDDVIDIGALSHAAWHNSEGIKDYALAVVFGVVGIALVASFSWWSILGLVLLLNPLTVFLPKQKYWLFVFTRDGESLAERGSSRCWASCVGPTYVAGVVKATCQQKSNSLLMRGRGQPRISPFQATKHSVSRSCRPWPAAGPTVWKVFFGRR